MQANTPDVAEAIVTVLEGNLVKLETAALRPRFTAGYGQALADVRDVLVNLPEPPEEPPARDVAGAIIEELDDLLADLQQALAAARVGRGVSTSAGAYAAGVRGSLDLARKVRDEAVRP